MLELQVSTFADMEGEETFDASLLGSADEVVEERVSDDDVILIKGTKTNSAVSDSIQFTFLNLTNCLKSIYIYYKVQTS